MVNKTLNKTEIKLEITGALALRKDYTLPISWTVAKLIDVMAQLYKVIDATTLWRSSNAYPYLRVDGGQHILKGLIGRKREANAFTVLGLVDAVDTWNDKASAELSNLFKSASPESWKAVSKKRSYVTLGEVYFLSLGRHLSYSADGKLKTGGHMGTTPAFTTICNLVANGNTGRRTTMLEDNIVISGHVRKAALTALQFSDDELNALLGLTEDADSAALASAGRRKRAKK